MLQVVFPCIGEDHLHCSTCSITLLKVGVTLCTVNWESPAGVWKAVYVWEDYFLCTCQYPLHKSRVAMYLAVPIFSNKSSVHIHSNSSFLKMMTTGMHNSEQEGSITPSFNIFSTSCCNFSHQLLWNPVRMMPDGWSILLTKRLGGIHGAVPAGHTSSFVFSEPRAGWSQTSCCVLPVNPSFQVHTVLPLYPLYWSKATYYLVGKDTLMDRQDAQWDEQTGKGGLCH